MKQTNDTAMKASEDERDVIITNKRESIGRRLVNLSRRVIKFLGNLVKTIVRKIRNIVGSGCHGIKRCYQKLSKKIKILLSIAISAIVIVVVMILMILHHTPGAKHYATVDDSDNGEVAAQMQIASVKDKQANQLQQQLNSLKQSIKQSTLSDQHLNQLTSQMQALQENVTSLRQSADGAKQAALKSAEQSARIQAVAKQQSVHIEKQLSGISKAVIPQHYLPPSALPFRVAGIDYWGNRLMASVAMRDMSGGVHYRLMSKGMSFDCQVQSMKVASCTNWTLQKISNSPNEVVFINTQGQKVKVQL